MSVENIQSNEQAQKPPYHTLPELLDQIEGINGSACREIYAKYQRLFETTAGSSHNHQAWEGGYADHVTETMNIVANLYDFLSSTGREMLFTRSDALAVMFVHDLEKPFKYTFDVDGNLIDNPDIPDKAARAAKREQIMEDHNMYLGPQFSNAYEYVEGIRDHEYTNQKRIMGELAALCHCADILSARMWYNYPLPEGQDPWPNAARVNPIAQRMLFSEIL